jgi:hypothetical protein
MIETIAQSGESQKPARPARRWFIGLFLLGLLVRVVLWLTYEPISYGDTESYLRLGQWILGMGERGFDGTRVLGYPVFVALMNLDPTRIWLGQMALGFVISGLLFTLGWQTTGRAWVGFLLGSLYNLIPGQLLFEANLLTETLTTFFIVLTLVLFLGLIRSSSFRAQLILASALGITASLVGMVRPLFFPLTLLFLPFLWFGTTVGRKQQLAVLVTYAIFPLLIQGGWLLYMRTNWDVLSPTTMAGFSMVQHTGGYFEYLPDEYAAIRDTYIEYRDAQIAERGVQTNAIWEAIPAISEASGIGFYNLSKEMNRLSWMLIREHPGLYLQNVVRGWINFWKAPVYWQPDVLQSTFIRTTIWDLSWVGRGLSVLANSIFLLLGIGILFSRRLRSWIRMDKVMWVSVAMVWLISIIQTLLDHGDNPRFLVPMQMIVIFVVMASFRKIRVHREAARPRL